MEAIWNEARQIPWQGPAGGTYTGGPFRGVVHTTESKDFYPSTTTYYGRSDPPHFTIAMTNNAAVVFQHYSVKVAARALANPPGGVQTNRQSAIQIEIAWTAADIAHLPEAMIVTLKQWMRWVESQTGIQRVAPTFYGPEAYGHGSLSRMSAEEWNAFNGWCGHQHVPENEHWDPGRIDIVELLKG